MNYTYILKDGVPVEEPDMSKWGYWFQTGKRIVQQDDFDDVRVSTVFLGMDHSFGEREPVLWETMILGGEHDDYQDRCSGTWDDALAMHKKALEICDG